jgi:1-acyl-sn-glycerol-3-phosphate acyltransferase
MNRGTAWYRFIRAAVRTLVFGILGGIKRVHPEREPQDQALIVAPLHFSFLDPPLVACAMRRAITFMAKEELFKPFLIGPLIRSLGAFPVRRGAGDSEAIKIALRLLNEGRAVLVFPEGTRGNGEQMGTLTPGVAMLAKRTGARVLPVGIVGTHEVLPKGRSKPKRAPMTVVFGESFTYAEICGEANDKDARGRFNDELQRRLVEAAAVGGLALRTAPGKSNPIESVDPQPPIEA